MTALKRLALPAELVRARPKRLRFLIFNTAGRLVHHARQLMLRLAAATEKIAAWAPQLSTGRSSKASRPRRACLVILSTDYHASFFNRSRKSLPSRAPERVRAAQVANCSPFPTRFGHSITCSIILARARDALFMLSTD
jgi:hypothetical protein